MNKIANAISKAEVQTFVKGEEVRNSTWYLLNIEPNQNQNATEFWKKLVTKLVYENEALIFGINNHLYVADSFEQVKFSFRENIYRNIVLKDFSVKTIFNESSVIHLTLNNRNIKSVIDGFYKMYGNLITQGIANYKKMNNRKFSLTSEGQVKQDK
ncbi:phage portal protein, partial [Listeria fleischmannii]